MNSKRSRAAVLKTADLTYSIVEIDLEPISAYRFSNHRDLEEDFF
jgi:hypothetical protein